MKRVNKALRNNSDDRIIEVDKFPSDSMLSALSDGFSVVLYSRTHKYIPKVLDKSLGVRLILSDKMNLLFHGHLIHGSAKSRINEDGVLSKDKRLFYYVWNTSIWSQKEDGGYIYRMYIPICSSYHSDINVCHDCENCIESIFDLSKVDITNISAGDTIFGNLDYLGWLVVKGVTMSTTVTLILSKHSTNNKWNRIGRDHGASMKFPNNNCTKQYNR